MIEALGWHYPQAARPAAARASLASDWLRDLGHLPADILDAACTAWRRAPNTYAPTPGHLLALAEPILHTRQFWAKRAAEIAGLPEPTTATHPPRKDQA
ncbi:hypothetical protein M1105_19775 [Limibaculum sp. FT325]|uniref:hypothetical protein n=1 Tax=Thermohalobaculum sediminis TaxID=2939436 RepID=UPI0020BD8D91|nr:hypothetical protein [Limibaculum sediminis]MCL5779206.1 hypothetical protein [Limibaculum sediminis]